MLPFHVSCDQGKSIENSFVACCIQVVWCLTWARSQQCCATRVFVCHRPWPLSSWPRLATMIQTSSQRYMVYHQWNTFLMTSLIWFWTLCADFLVEIVVFVVFNAIVINTCARPAALQVLEGVWRKRGGGHSRAQIGRCPNSVMRPLPTTLLVWKPEMFELPFESSFRKNDIQGAVIKNSAIGKDDTAISC